MAHVVVLGLVASVFTAGPQAPLALPMFSYSDSASAQRHWEPQFDSVPVKVLRLPGGSTCLGFTATFDRPGQRACWDWKGKLDLSRGGRLVLEISAEGGGAGGTLGVYFGSGPGWYARFASAALPESWTTLVFRLDSFRAEDKPAGWDKVGRFRFSVWSAGAGTVTYRVRQARVLAADPAENFVKNGSFEIVCDGIPYAWGSGHWGVGHLPWATDMDLWRRHWHLDSGVARHGTHSLCLDNAPDLPLLRAYSVWITPPPSAKTLVVSVWAKAGQEGVPVVLQAAGKSTKAQVGREWKQIVLAGVPRKPRTLIVVAPQAAGKVWIDAVQMQAGSKATRDFHPAFADAAIAAREKQVDWTPPRREPRYSQARPVTGPLAPQPEGVRIDSHGRFLVGGKPYLQYSLGLEYLDDLSILDFVAKSGFPDVCLYIRPQVTTAQLKDIFDRCAKVGLHIIPWLGAGLSRERFDQHISTLRNHPALLAWYVYDEPSGERFAEAEARCNRARELDPGHPAFINYLSNKLEGHKGDIYSTDVYPIPHSTPMAAVNAVERMAAAAAKEHKPVWIWLQGTGFAYWMDREPAPRELDCMVYGSLIRGARGVYYFAQVPRSKACFAEMRALAGEVRRLVGPLSSLQAAPAVTCDQPSVLCRAYRDGAAVWVLAVNTGRQPCRARFSLGGVSGPVDVVFEGRRLQAHEGTWRDDFGQYERHVYRCRLGG